MLGHKSLNIKPVPFSNVRRRFERDNESIENLNRKFDRILIMVQDVKKEISSLKKRADYQENRFNNVNNSNQNMEKKINEISDKLINLENILGLESHDANYQPTDQQKDQTKDGHFLKIIPEKIINKKLVIFYFKNFFF